MYTLSKHTIPEKPEDLQPVVDVFGQPVLRQIVQKAKFLLDLNCFMQTILPAPFAPYCQVLNLNEYTLILGVSSAALITRIQCLSDELLKALRNDKRYSSILNIRCKVVPDLGK